MTVRAWLIVLSLPLLLLACKPAAHRRARALVARYNEAVCEAYRKGDIRLIDPVVGPQAVDGTRLTGLIGVRADMGILLDARLEALEVLGVEEGPEDLQVRTRERWQYRDVEAKTGRQVGEASVDHYEMLYHFKKLKGAWMVEETKFAATPQVGRKEIPWGLDARDAHGMATVPPQTPAQGGKP